MHPLLYHGFLVSSLPDRIDQHYLADTVWNASCSLTLLCYYNIHTSSYPLLICCICGTKEEIGRRDEGSVSGDGTVSFLFHQSILVTLKCVRLLVLKARWHQLDGEKRFLCGFHWSAKWFIVVGMWSNLWK